MVNDSGPRGGVTPQKYAAICLALAVARGALHGVILEQDIEGAKDALDITSTRAIAEAIGLNEGDLAVDWNDYLSPSESNRIKGWG